MAHPVDAMLAPLDTLRLRLLQATRPVSGVVASHRALRVTLVGLVGVCASLFLAVKWPRVLIDLGPLWLGVPHLVAGLRHLVVRPGVHRERRPWPAFAALATAAVALLAAWHPSTSLAMAHLHNGVALVLWWRWRERSALHALVPLAVGFGAVAILAGAADGALTTLDGAWLPRPSWPDPWGARSVALFAFLQSVHYLAWLRLVPEDDRPQPTTRTFRATFRALGSDLGWPFVTLAALLSAAFAAWTFIDVEAAGLAYFRLAAFHGPLEWGVIAWARTARR